MAEKEEKTEEPTGKRKSEARRKGNVTKSSDLSSAIVLLAGALALWMLGKYMGAWILNTMRESFLSVKVLDLSAGNFAYFTNSALKLGFFILGPFLLVMAVVAIIVNVLQTGGLFTMYPLKPKFGKIFALEGFKKLVSPEKLIDMGKNIIKMTMIGIIGYNVVSSHYMEYVQLADQSVRDIMLLLLSVLLELMIKCAILLIIIGIVDYVYQRYKNHKSLKMTKQEVKDEMKAADGDPKIKNRLRSLRLEMHRKLMMQQVPEATVVVTNPTYIAIAIKYVLNVDKAPMVVAKGKRLVAERIKAIALQHEIPIVENKPLARSMFDVVEVGQEIPEEFFASVAEILAYVYSLKNQGAHRAMA